MLRLRFSVAVRSPVRSRFSLFLPSHPIAGFLPSPRGRQSDRVVDLLLPIDAVIGLLGQAVDTADTAAIDVTGGGLAGGGTHPQFEGLPAAAPASSTPSVSTIPGGEGVEPFSRVGGEARGAGSLPWSVSQGATTS